MLQLWACHTQERTGKGKLMSSSLPLLSTKKKNKQKQYLCLAEDSPVKRPSLPEWQERTVNGVGSDRAVTTTGIRKEPCAVAFGATCFLVSWVWK